MTKTEIVERLYKIRAEELQDMNTSIAITRLIIDLEYDLEVEKRDRV